MTFIEQQLSNAASKDGNVFWNRSVELQQAELAHADIRKGLELDELPLLHSFSFVLLLACTVQVFMIAGNLLLCV
jgi:hypothetical protein